MNPEASRRELLRRACFDLTGLPPSPEEAAAFESDASPDSYARLLDRLLASPRYGERWARHWLDVARFAQSNGYERDAEKLLAWRYRICYQSLQRRQAVGSVCDGTARR